MNKTKNSVGSFEIKKVEWDSKLFTQKDPKDAWRTITNKFPADKPGWKVFQEFVGKECILWLKLQANIALVEITCTMSFEP